MPNMSNDISTNLGELLKLEHLVIQRKLIPNKQVHSILAGKNISKLRGRGLDFEEVRRYVNGDDIRNIDWKVTARTRVTHTKVFTEEKERPVFTIVDQSSRMLFGSVQYTKSVVAAQLAAISAFRTLKVGDRFGGLVFNDSSESYIQPKRSRAAVLRYLEQVVEYNEQLVSREKIEAVPARLNEMLKRTQATVTHDYVVTVISDFLTLNEETKKHLINLAQHNDVILVRVTDPFEKNAPQERVLMGDGDNQLEWKNARHQSTLLQQSIDEREMLFATLRKYGIVSLNIDTATTVEEQLKEIFHR